MITIGVDAHKKTHTLVAVDQVGHRLAEVPWLRPQRGTCGRCIGQTPWPQPVATVTGSRFGSRSRTVGT